MFDFFRRKPKEQLDCLGVYEIKPYHYFESNMTYAKDALVYNQDGIKVYTRLYKSTLFIFTFVENEMNYQKRNFTYEALKEKIDAVIIDPHTALIQLVVFKNNNSDTIRIASEVPFNSKKEFNQSFVYDAEKIRLKFYRPVPDFYQLYNHYAEALIFDLGVIDLEKR
ncbi:MAG: hypothetical protein K2N64_00830 [Anaeroplasmataceae bacterium]|nr:hypothetical protein [Anaeroplasmataceae bacterium]